MSKFTINLTKFWSWHFSSFPTSKSLIRASIEAVEIVKRAKRLSTISPYSFDDCVYLAHLTKDDSEIEKAFELAVKLNRPPYIFIIDKRYKCLIAGGE